MKKSLYMAAAFMVGAASVLADDLVIQSFDHNGNLTFNKLGGFAGYRVEWAPAPGGPWTNFTGAAGAALDGMLQHQVSAIVTCTVPMCYRVVAMQAPPGMVLIPAGSNSGADPDYGAYTLQLDNPLYFDAKEIDWMTWQEVRTWAATNGYDIGAAGGAKGSLHPVFAYWHQCVKWCNARSEKDGLEPCYTVTGAVYRAGTTNPVCNWSATGYRLPLNDEWEYAARGGIGGTRFPWGDTITHSNANYYSSASYAYDVGVTRGWHPDYYKEPWPYTSPCGTFAPNGYALYDMAGNTWEWCWDPTDASATRRYLRGGGFLNNADRARCGDKEWSDYASQGGFRTCRRVAQ